jgi:hypothetical protein
MSGVETERPGFPGGSPGSWSGVPGLNRWSAWLATLVVFVVSVCANGLFSGIAHDEGDTVDLSVGRIEPSLMSPHEPVPITELQACVDGSVPKSAGQVLDELSMPDKPYPPAYFLIMRGWTALTGVDRVAMRVPGVLFGMLTLLGLSFLARRLIPWRLAEFWVPLLAALSPWFAAISTFARPYSFVLAIGTWSTVVALRLCDGGSQGRSRVLFVLLSLIGLHGLYHYGFVVVWQGLFLAVMAWRTGQGVRRRELWMLVLMGAVIAAGFAPWATRLPAHLEYTGSIPFYFSGSVVQRSGFEMVQLLWTFFLGDGLAADVRYGMVVALLVLIAVSLPLLLRRSPSMGDARRDAIARVFFITTAFYPAVLLLGDILHGTRTLTISKTSFMLFTILLLLVFRAWASIPNPRWRAAGPVLWTMLLGGATVFTFVNRLDMVDHHRVVAASLAADDRPDHHVLLNCIVRGHAIPLMLTLQECGVQNVRVVLAPTEDLDQILARTLASPGVRRITMLNLHTVLDTYYDVPHFWSRETLEAAARRAHETGWQVARGVPDRHFPRPRHTIVKHRLEIFSPVR